MAKNIYVIGIGGTGMRCIESFIHLCAIGMFDDTNVNLLALDTDKLNGNFKRLQTLAEQYRKINGGKPKKDTLFSANLEYYQFSPDYDRNDCSFNTVIDRMGAVSTELGENVKSKLSDLMDLIIRPEVGEMSLAHGYRAQTQMGSMLMYHAVLEEAYKAKDNTSSGLRNFLNKIVNAQGGQPVFVFGSVFGGTGASSIPILPHAFNDAAKVLFGESTELVKGNLFGSVVLTNYFSFDIADSDKVVAKSTKFALNSQAALKFYRNDPTINEVYKRLYVIGRGQMRSVPSGGTGGASQCNPADYIELMAAFAAYDFFKKCAQLPSDPNVFDNDTNSPFVAKSINAEDSLSFENFTEDHEEFMERLGIMTVASFMDSGYFYFDNLRREFMSFDEKDLDPLRKYFQLFGIEPYNEDNVEKTGWLNQIFDSAVADGFQKGAFFNPALFGCKTEKDFKKYKVNELLYNMETPPAFPVGLLTNKFSVVKDKFKDVKPSDNGSLESLIERTFLTLRSLYFDKTK